MPDPYTERGRFAITAVAESGGIAVIGAMTEPQIPLVGGGFAIVDAADYARLIEYEWRRLGEPGHFYAYRYEKVGPGEWRKVFMHRVVNETPDGLFTDHINGDGLDNRRLNLRTVTHAQNMKNRRRGKNNRSGAKGVSFDPEKGRWRAAINVNGKRFRLGRFDTVEEASEAYERAAKEHFGEYQRA